MKHPFEEWLSGLNLKEVEKMPFEEAFTCYRVKAYRAALLFSYIGFLTILKNRIIRSTIPECFKEIEWEKQVLSPLKDDNNWESSVFDLTQQQKKKIFNISDDIREQIKYWRARRNDCAHLKDNIIDDYHVDSFLAFLRSNLNKITIEGSKNNLIKQFEDFFDETKTSPSADIVPLISEIPHAVDKKDLNEFWETLFVDENYTDYYAVEKTFRITNAVFSNLNEKFVIESIVEFYKSNAILNEINYLKQYPEQLPFFNFTSAEIREIWMERLYSGNYVTIFNLFTYLLRNNFIPGDEKEEAIETIILKTDHDVPEEKDFELLSEVGFFEKVGEKLHDWLKYNFSFVNKKSDLIVCYLLNFKMDEELVKKICNYQTQEYPSFRLGRALVDEFRKSPGFHDEFIKLAKDSNSQIPRDFEDFVR